MSAVKNCQNCQLQLGPRRRKFCCNRCKDTWHNWSKPRGMFAHLGHADWDNDMRGTPYEDMPDYGSCHGQDSGD